PCPALPQAHPSRCLTDLFRLNGGANKLFYCPMVYDHDLDDLGLMESERKWHRLDVVASRSTRAIY
ncbi:MAG: hypothetical protein P8163_22690, partial [Candidatus Thiodiazotropha sp.]